MIGLLANLGSAFLLGLATPLTAVCVIPLYPGFIAFLTNRPVTATVATPTGPGSPAVGTAPPALLGVAVVAGTISFMAALGVVFTTLLQISLTRVVGIVSPIAFAVLLLVSIALLLDLDLGRLAPRLQAPTARNPVLAAFLFGFFFGAIVLPCNPGFIAIFFAKTAAIPAADFAAGLLQFFAFGLGIGAPLLVLAVLSGSASRAVVRALVRYKSVVNRTAGAAMLVLSAYFLVCDFHVFGISFGLCNLLLPV